MFWSYWNGFWGTMNLGLGIYFASTLNIVIGILCLIVFILTWLNRA